MTLKTNIHTKSVTFNIIIIMSTLLLQWNIRGLNQNYTSGLQHLIYDLNPEIICLQETKLSDNFEKKNTNLISMLIKTLPSP